MPKRERCTEDLQALHKELGSQAPSTGLSVSSRLPGLEVPGLSENSVHFAVSSVGGRTRMQRCEKIPRSVR